MACDVMTVRLHLPQIRVLEVVEDTPGALVVSVESTLLRLRCAQCGFKCRQVHDRRAKRVRDLEVSGRRMTLVWQRRRMVCSNCASRFLEDHPAFEGALTARLARRVVADAKVMTFSAAARRHGVHWHAVRALVDTWSALVAERRRSRRCAVLLVDETSMRKRHRYVTVIVNGDTGRTLAMVQHRSSAALSAFLMQQGHRWCKGVKVVVSDGSKAYKAAIGAHLGHARHVLDRFHVIRWFSAGLTAVRRDVQRRPEGSKPAFEPEVFRARFALLRRGDTLTDADRARLDALFDAHPRLKAGWHKPLPGASTQGSSNPCSGISGRSGANVNSLHPSYSGHSATSAMSAPAAPASGRSYSTSLGRARSRRGMYRATNNARMASWAISTLNSSMPSL